MTHKFVRHGISIILPAAFLLLPPWSRSCDAQGRFPRLRQRIEERRKAQRQATAPAQGQVKPRPAGACGSSNVGFRIYQFKNGPKAAIWYPTTSAETAYQYSNGLDSAVAPNAPVAACGRYPLVVFSHGFGGCGTQSVFFTEELARQGYIVAAPDHKDAKCKVDQPREGRRRLFQRAEEPFRKPEKWDENTYIDRRQDIETVINQMLESRDFGPHIDGNRIGGAGHSLGGYTMLGLAGGWKSWQDSRIKAVLLFSPYAAPFLLDDRLKRVDAPVMYQGGSRDFGITPSLKKQGGAYDMLPPPKYFVEFPGAGHLDWSVRVCNEEGTVDRCVADTVAGRIDEFGIAFLNKYLKGRNPAILTGKHPPGTQEYRFDAR